jgi:hypothetical protein
MAGSIANAGLPGPDYGMWVDAFGRNLDIFGDPLVNPDR